MFDNVIREIQVERTLVVGDARVSAGTECYIKYRDIQKQKCALNWMYAMCVDMTDDSVLFRLMNGTHITLKPNDIELITDKPNLTEEQVDCLMYGDILECKNHK